MSRLPSNRPPRTRRSPLCDLLWHPAHTGLAGGTSKCFCLGFCVVWFCFVLFWGFFVYLLSGFWGGFMLVFFVWFALGFLGFWGFFLFFVCFFFVWLEVFFGFCFVLIKGKSANLLGIVVRREMPFEIWGWGGFNVYPCNASFMFSPKQFHSRNSVPLGFGEGYSALLCCCCFASRWKGSCGVGKGKIGSRRFRPH